MTSFLRSGDSCVKGSSLAFSRAVAAMLGLSLMAVALTAPARSSSPPEIVVAQALERPPVVTTVTTAGKPAADAVSTADAAGKAVPAIPQLQRFAASTKAATGRFVQTQLGSGRRVSGSSKGQFAFSRPGNFRWEIESPDQQLIVTDGRKLYFHDRDLQQVTIRQASESIQATPAAVLFGVGDLNDSFRLTEIGSRGGVAWVEAIPKKADSGFEQIRVGMRGGQPVVMEVIDAFGQINRFEFQNLKVLDSVPAERFRFTPPPGVDVLE